MQLLVAHSHHTHLAAALVGVGAVVYSSQGVFNLVMFFSSKTPVCHPSLPVSTKNPNDLSNDQGKDSRVWMINYKMTVSDPVVFTRSDWLTLRHPKMFLQKTRNLQERTFQIFLTALLGIWKTTLLLLLVLRNFSWDKSSAILSELVSIAQPKALAWKNYRSWSDTKEEPVMRGQDFCCSLFWLSVMGHIPDLPHRNLTR